MRVWADSVEETTQTDPGVGDLELSGATEGNRAFSVIGDGNECDYRVETDDLSIWEIGSGTYDSGTNELSRDQIYTGTSGAGVKVNLTGICTVYLTLTARRIGWRLPLVTGERTTDGGPVIVSDPSGQCIGVPVE